jgi:hypothetical protein
MPPHPSASRTVILTGIDGRYFGQCECGHQTDAVQSEAVAHSLLYQHLRSAG